MGHRDLHYQGVGRLALVSPAATSARGRSEFEQRFAERANDPRIAEARKRLAASGLRQLDPGAHKKRMFELAVAPYFRDPERASELTPFRVASRTPSLSKR